MKYKVIGWTYYENNEILSSGNKIGFAERNAIIDEIRKHKYLFSGWHHQESWDGVVPILNDGRKRCFSQRGWGGVMAEAYGYMDDYDYASFTFHQSIPSKELRFAPESYDLDDYEPEVIENEDFKVDVNEGLFAIAKTSNPFYLEDLDELRYIDENDSITLCCNGEELYFIVKDIDRNKVSIGLKNASKLIKGKYKIIVTHKPISERKVAKVPVIITTSKALDMFSEAIEEYNYDVIQALIDSFDVDYLAEKLQRKKVKDALSKFVREYINDSFKPGNVVQILKYINNYKLFEEIATETLETKSSIYYSFINYYLEKNKNMDSHILKFVDLIKPSDDFWNIIDILFKAIIIKPNDKSLRKKYYKAIEDTRFEGLSIMAGANLFKYLREEDREFIELDKYSKYDENTIMDIVEYLTYPNDAAKDPTYPCRLPKIYEINEQVISDGIKAYQEYVKERFDVDSIMEKMILHGIDKKCFEMDCYLHGEEDAAKYIYALDILTNYKYNLKEKALTKYASKYANFEKIINELY